MERIEPLPIGPGAVLRRFKTSDAGELTEAIAANREHLARWLPWAESHGFEDSVEYLDRKRAQIEANDGFEGAIVLDGRIVGGPASTASAGSTGRPRSAIGSPPTRLVAA
jgi:hypothetical protein